MSETETTIIITKIFVLHINVKSTCRIFDAELRSYSNTALDDIKLLYHYFIIQTVTASGIILSIDMFVQGSLYNKDRMNVQIQTNINKQTLYFKVIFSSSDSLPTCLTAAVAIAMD